MLKIKARLKFLLLKILFLACAVNGRKYTQCELSTELQNIHNVAVDQTKKLVCIAQKFSRLNTNIVAGELYGIFQINSKWCEIGKEGGECNVKCENLLNDDIADDVKCAQSIITKFGMNGWRMDKIQGCIKNFDDNCPNKEEKMNQQHANYCEYATKLIASYDISKLDAMTWSCIKQHHSDTHALKTGNVNLKLAENDDQIAATCVAIHDVECSIKINKQRNNYDSMNGFSIWPEYKEFCKNISGDEITKCFGIHHEVIIKSESEGTKLTAFESPTKEINLKQFTTSTEISVIIEDDQSVTIKNEPETSTEFLSKTIEKPADNMMIEGYSKVRLMFSDEDKIENSTRKDDLPVNNSLRCDITRNFIESGQIPLALIDTFVCIAEHESKLNVTLVKEIGDVQKYGLFQIDDLNYCNTNDKINYCDVLCLHLLDNQYDNDLECVKKIYEREGFDYWPSYSRHCRNVSSNLVVSCQEIRTTTHRPYTVPNYELLKQKFNLSERLETTTKTIAEKNDVIKIEEEDQTTIAPILMDILKQFDICEFSQYLYSNENISLKYLTDYVCIADQASKLRILKSDENGIFGLKNDACEKCSIDCKEFTNENLHDDVQCVTKIYKENSLSYWNLTEEICKPYSNKILQCINQDKFITVDDEDEFNFSKVSARNKKMEESKEAEETIVKNELQENIEKNQLEETTEKQIIENSSAEKVHNDVNIENDKVRLLLHNTLDDLLKELAQNLTNEEMSSIKVPLEKLSQAETEKNYTEEDISKMEQKIRNALNGILKILEENDTNKDESTTLKESLNNDSKLLTNKEAHVNDSESELSRKVIVKQGIDGKIITEKDSEESVEDLDEDHLTNSMIDDESLMTTEIPKISTISLINLKVLTDKKQKLVTNDDESIITTTENGEILTTLNQDQLTPSTFIHNLKTFENERKLSTTTNDPLFYTSVQEIIEDYEKFDDRNIVKRKTTQYPESDEDFTTTEDSAEMEIATSQSFVTTTAKPSTTTKYDPEKITFPPLSYGVVDKCALIRNIRESDKIPSNLISTFVCIAEHESGLNVSLIRSDGGKNRKMRYGIFQIDEMEYCNTNEKINKCDVLCAHLNDDQFDNDLECVMQIYNTEGLKYWPSYSRHCSHIDPKAFDDDCRVVFTTSHRPFTPFDREAALRDLFTTTAATTTTTTIQTTTVALPKYNYTDDESNFIIRRYDLCELANEVYKNNVSLEETSQLVCVADLVSKLKIKRPLLEDDKFGIFQIDKQYCEEGGICGIKCSDLLDDDLSDDIHCLNIIGDNKTMLWNLSNDACTSYHASFLNCIDNDLFQTTKDPSSMNAITPWIGFLSTTTEAMTHQESEEETTTSYYDNGILTTIEVLKSTQFPSVEQEQAISPLHEFLLPPHFDESSTTTEFDHSTSTEKPVTLSILLEPPHFNEKNEETTTINDIDETTIAVNSNITEEDLKRVVDIILSPDNILPKVNLSDENNDETTIESIIENEAKSSEITTEKSQDETLPTLEISTTQKSSNKNIETVHQFLLPPKDDKNEGGEEIEIETEKPEEFRIVVTSGEITTLSIENLITPTTDVSEINNSIHTEAEQTTKINELETSHSTHNEFDTTTKVPSSSYSSPIFKRRSTTKSIQMNEVTPKIRNLVTSQLNNNRRRISTTTTEKYENIFDVAEHNMCE
ncbi:hypothetical protein PVAND_008897 [Polypedilum vanderplanki]|uniref:lysozyme n=1 Tax=Polypedilum vanderplanki TaxID=319348 RepID=A0A9J6CB20_POLVA|nr:hypothetical protein PVAND_008897 [Polypedilum vanderplanki]